MNPMSRVRSEWGLNIHIGHIKGDKKFKKSSPINTEATLVIDMFKKMGSFPLTVFTLLNFQDLYSMP